jgi:hypothetical protein
VLTAGTLLVFHSTHDVLAAEDALNAAGVDYQVIPKPRIIKADCGLAVLVAAGRAEAAERALREAGIPLVGTHEYSRRA